MINQFGPCAVMAQVTREVTDSMLHGVDRDAVFWAWRDMSDATSGDCDFDAAMLPEYLKSAEGACRHA